MMSKAATKEQESIFKWPFKSKLNLKKNNSFDMNHDSYSYQRPVSGERSEKDLQTLEKNERIKRSIYERLYSSSSMPDLIQRDDYDYNEPKIKESHIEVAEKMKIQIHKGIEVTDESTQFVTVDEIKLPKRPARAKVKKAPEIPIQIPPPIENQKSQEEEIIEVDPPKPPTPPRRQSRSNSLRASQIEFLTQLPPLVMPRRNINQNYVPIHSVDESLISEEDQTEKQPQQQQLKSILKSGNNEEAQTTTKTHHIKFINVPDSPIESSEDEGDVWDQINMHRNQLNRFKEDESEKEEEIPPPLPKTPPPVIDEPSYLRDFVIA